MRRPDMRRLAIPVVVAMLAAAYGGADASEKAHRKHAATPPKAAAKAAPAQPVENPVIRQPVPQPTVI